MVKVYCEKSGLLKAHISGATLDLIVASGRTKRDNEGRLVTSDTFECGGEDVKVVFLVGDVFLI